MAQFTPPFPTMEAVAHFSSGAVSNNQFMMRLLWLVIKAEMLLLFIRAFDLWTVASYGGFLHSSALTISLVPPVLDITTDPN